MVFAVLLFQDPNFRVRSELGRVSSGLLEGSGELSPFWDDGPGCVSGSTGTSLFTCDLVEARPRTRYPNVSLELSFCK